MSPHASRYMAMNFERTFFGEMSAAYAAVAVREASGRGPEDGGGRERDRVRGGAHESDGGGGGACTADGPPRRPSTASVMAPSPPRPSKLVTAMAVVQRPREVGG